ncbi:hypothetical protein [Anaerobacillus arseniciselenatis]|uniref:hypothetical protein n=1 Tax=Anaerobacillus arseniciselenatis TaxID=85682 RepID=UPI0014712A41|nr:hypothetical protein [Anaerobacillus arseniciselenatis]
MRRKSSAFSVLERGAHAVTRRKATWSNLKAVIHGVIGSVAILSSFSNKFLQL